MKRKLVRVELARVTSANHFHSERDFTHYNGVTTPYLYREMVSIPKAGVSTGDEVVESFSRIELMSDYISGNSQDYVGFLVDNEYVLQCNLDAAMCIMGYLTQGVYEGVIYPARLGNNKRLGFILDCMIGDDNQTEESIAEEKKNKNDKFKISDAEVGALYDSPWCTRFSTAVYLGKVGKKHIWAAEGIHQWEVGNETNIIINKLDLKSMSFTTTKSVGYSGILVVRAPNGDVEIQCVASIKGSLGNLKKKRSNALPTDVIEALLDEAKNRL